MEQKYKITAIIISLFIAFCPLLTNGFISYAEENLGGGGGGAWQNVSTHEEIVAAFKAYCQYRNLDIEHQPSTLNAIVKWDYSQLERAAALANIDLEGLNAHIWYAMETNKPLKFYFDRSGALRLSQIYGSLLSENNLSNNQNKTVYSGKYFEDSDGNECYCFVINQEKNNNDNIYTNSISEMQQYVSYGSYYRYTGLSFFTNNPEGNYPESINYQGTTIPYYLTVSKNSRGKKVELSKTSQSVNSYDLTYCIYCDWNNEISRDGYLAITYNSINHKYYLSSYIDCNASGYPNNRFIYLNTYIILTNAIADDSQIDYKQGNQVQQPVNKSIQITTNDNSVTNYITNNNSTVTNNYYDDDEPPEDKTKLPTTPNYPTGGTQDPDGTFHWTMPDLDIDFHINSDISNIFPFSIPFDIIHFFDIFDSEPVTPEVDTSFEIFNIEIPIQFDLHWLDDTAAYVRAFVLALYCFGLAIATRALFHIY